MDERCGIVDLSQGDDGRLRKLDKTFIATERDPLIPARLVDQFQLRPGNLIKVHIGDQRGPERKGKKRRRKKTRLGREMQQAPRVDRILEIEQTQAEDYQTPALLEDATSIDPQPQLTLEYPDCPPACRLIDLFCPIGYGQRGLIVSPPKAGKTVLLQQLATAVHLNHPQCVVWSLLIDERPEEVTDFRRNSPCDVFASSNDHTPEKHVGIAIHTIERAKRLAEQGKHVVLLLDSLTRLGRAFNTAPNMIHSGRTLSGGVDATALSIPKQLFGAARNTEEAGSLSIIATCLIDTGSRGDQLIFEEFKGTGNMELILDRSIAERRVYPAIDLAASGTRKDHLLLSDSALKTSTMLRRRLINMKPLDQVQQLLKALSVFKTNTALIEQAIQPAAAAQAS